MKWLKNALLKEASIIKLTTPLLEFQPGPTETKLMKANEPQTRLPVDWNL